MLTTLSRPLGLVVVGAAGVLAGVALASCGGDGGTTSTTSTAATTTTTTTHVHPTTGTGTTGTGTDTTPTAEPVVVRITVEGGIPAGGIVRRTVKKGDRVILVVTSDVADEVHLHGYDLSRDVKAGGRARIPFRATLPGRFEVELERRSLQIAELTVQA